MSINLVSDSRTDKDSNRDDAGGFTENDVYIDDVLEGAHVRKNRKLLEFAKRKYLHNTDKCETTVIPVKVRPGVEPQKMTERNDERGLDNSFWAMDSFDNQMRVEKSTLF